MLFSQDLRVLSGKREESCQHLASIGDFSFFFFHLSSLVCSLYTLLLTFKDEDILVGDFAQLGAPGKRC